LLRIRMDGVPMRLVMETVQISHSNQGRKS
jgi:hypothetical protein